jgi:hypothetical protein
VCCVVLPVYSPDLNPIEASGNRVRRFVRSKVKVYLGEARARIRGDLLTANVDGPKPLGLIAVLAGGTLLTSSESKHNRLSFIKLL